MDYLIVNGGKKLSGEVKISGAKNSALPLIALSVIAKNSTHISNIPEVADIKTLLKLLANLGAVSTLKENRLTINTNNINKTEATYDIVKTMRASILVLGPILSRFGHCEVSLPGGCAIGERPVDLHIKALEQMGASIVIENGYIKAKAPNGLKGAKIVFDKITVTGCENIIMAAAIADGTTQILNAAREPEVVQLCEVLSASGVKIEGIGTANITIEGTKGKLIDIVDFEIIADRIEAGTYMCAGAITNSKITLTNVTPEHLSAFSAKLEQMGFGIETTDTTITILPAKKIVPINITTTEYPGFPTDMQAQFMALSLIADGTSIIEERLFENRFMHVSELRRLGATITLNAHTATIEGNSPLVGADVMATDLRASSALVLAGLVAKGSTKIHRIYHLYRGYENLVQKLIALGADVQTGQE